MAPGSYRLSGKTMGWHPEVPVVAEGWRFITTWGSAGSCVPQQEPTDCHVDISRHKVTANTSLHQQNHWIFAFYLLRFVQVPGDTAVWPSVFCSVNSLAISLYNTDPSCVHLHRTYLLLLFHQNMQITVHHIVKLGQLHGHKNTQKYLTAIKPESVSLHLKNIKQISKLSWE